MKKDYRNLLGVRCVSEETRQSGGAGGKEPGLGDRNRSLHQLKTEMYYAPGERVPGADSSKKRWMEVENGGASEMGAMGHHTRWKNVNLRQRKLSTTQ